ncbi:unnamed protein product [Orchesella dallaii]|uniref:Uncharacterized protein n=1 Tax=Orchesella dallaii TaxID=48710 RepID=A0ABP1PZG2_9HEXA
MAHKKGFFVSSESSDEEDADDVTQPKEQKHVTRVFNPEQGSFIRLKKKNALSSSMNVGKLTDALGLGKKSKHGTTSMTAAPKKLGKVKKTGHEFSVVLPSIDETAERKLHIQGSADMVAKSKGSMKGKKKGETWKKLQKANSDESAPNTPQIFTPSPPRMRTNNLIKPNKEVKKSNSNLTPARTNASKFPKNSPREKSNIQMTPVNARASWATASPKKKNRPEKRKSSPTAERGPSSSSWSSAKRIKLSNKPTEKSKLSKQGKNKSKEFTRNSDPRHSIDSQKSRFSGRLSNGNDQVSNKTPEYMKIKEDDSIVQKKERRRFRNKVMSLKTAKGQPVMRGRINLMLDKIKADLNVA